MDFKFIFYFGLINVIIYMIRKGDCVEGNFGKCNAYGAWRYGDD